MIVSAASKMSSAISFGVFFRLAPSTIAIMRSRKVSPGLRVIFTTSQSDRTVVPPVTAQKSPPLSRMTGALSPVIALSLTEATPSSTSPSPGMVSPASTRTVSPALSVEPATSSTSPSCRGAPWSGDLSFLAWTSLRALRRVSACALPRPSAIASAKFANSTVNHSHRDTVPTNQAGASPCATSAWTKRRVVNTLPTSTTNITGLLIIRRGSSFSNEPTMARWTIARSNRGRAG